MTPIKTAVSAFTIISLSACSLIGGKNDKKEQPKLDYQSQNRKVIDLEVPPDLTNPTQGNLYRLPAGSGAVRASDVSRNAARNAAGGQAVLTGVKGVKIERDGSQRWLAVSGKTPAELWPLLKAFWQESGFTIANEEPSIGQMETDWAENRAKLPGGGLRSLLEKVGLGGVYSTSERDKFIIRIEQGKNGVTDVFFAHKGMSETYTDRSEERTMWQPRANDPNLEAAFLARFMQYLGADEAQVERELQNSSASPSEKGSLAKLENGSILLSGDFQRNWRRTALALDRVGLTVVGQNTGKNAFLVQPAPNESSAVTAKKPGLISRLFGKKAEPEIKQLPQLIVHLDPAEGGARLRILNKDGSAYNGRELNAWLSRLHNELR